MRARARFLVQQLRALIDQREDAALDDLVIGDLARDRAPAKVGDERVDGWIGQRVAASRFVAVPAEPRLLAKASQLAQAIGDRE
jgi:hypothetical protein